MARTNLDDVGLQRLQIPDWAEGIITSKPSTEIPDNAAQDIVNMEHDDSNNLASRAGIQELYSDIFSTRFTSLHYFHSETAEIGILFTSGTALYLGQTDGSGFTDITGSLTLPSDTFWQWKTMNELAIGVNRATSGDNPVKVNTSGTAAALGGTPPNASFVEVWSNRLWLVGSDDPNVLYGSGLGDPEDWTIPGSPTPADPLAIEVEPGDGDQIMGLFATRDELFVFKRRRIYRVVAIDPAAPTTDGTNLQVVLYAQNIGAVSGYSIHSTLDDVAFYSELGLSSLKLAEGFEGFRTAQLSEKLAELIRVPKITDEIPAVVVDTVSQYWLSLPASISPTGNPVVYVLDYSRAPEKILRWVKFDGLAAGTAFTSWVDDVGKLWAIGAENSAGEWKIYTYRPRDYNRAFSDAGESYAQTIRSKAFTMGAPLIRKHFDRWAVGLGLLSDTAQINVQYYFDGNENKGGSDAFNLSGADAGARWDTAIWDSSEWDAATQIDLEAVQRFKSNSSGKRAQNVTFIVSNDQVNEGIVLKDMDIYWSPLNWKGVSDL